LIADPKSLTPFALPAGVQVQSDVRLAAPSLLRWLTLAALIEWLIGRTITRGAHFIPKTSPVLEVYQGLTLVGQFAFTLTGVLALVTLGWIAWRGRAEMRGIFSAILGGVIAASVLSIFITPASWMSVAYHALLLSGLGMITAQALGARRLALCALPAGALIMGEVYLLSGALDNALRVPAMTGWNITLYNAGELVVIAVPLVFWYKYARGRARGWIYAAAALPVLAFAAGYARSPALTGIIAMWSLGLSLYLPWVLYALSAWLMGVSLLALWRQRSGPSPELWGPLLLITVGFASPLTTQMLVGLIALWWLTRIEEESHNANFT
jgi:hypothetical protein